MWQNLSDDVRQQVQAAGPMPTRSIYNLEAAGAHRELFFQYFDDNADPQNKAIGECYWWLASKNLDGRANYGRRNRADIDEFWAAYGTSGAQPIAWPAEIVEWFEGRDYWTHVTAEAYPPEWNAADFEARWDDDDNEVHSPEATHYLALREQEKEWAQANPQPLPKARDYARDVMDGWVGAYADEVARMDQGQAAMTWRDLDLDYVVTLNTYNLGMLQPTAWHDCVGYGPYVLIGDFPPGYVAAVESYAAHWRGTVTMDARGSFGSAGSVTVQGCPAGEAQTHFKTTFRKSSKKSINFA